MNQLLLDDNIFYTTNPRFLSLSKHVFTKGVVVLRELLLANSSHQIV